MYYYIMHGGMMHLCAYSSQDCYLSTTNQPLSSNNYNTTYTASQKTQSNNDNTTNNYNGTIISTNSNATIIHNAPRENTYTQQY